MEHPTPSASTRSRPGIASPYEGRAGDRYVERYRGVYELSSKLNRSNFTPYISPTSTVVDFGCGDGGLLAELDVRSRIGVEATDAGIELARRRGLDRVVRSLDELPENIADVVISNHALEHTLNPAQELMEMFRLLRPGGRLVLWLPLDDWRSERRPDPTDPDHHLYAWTPLLLGNLLTEVGFELERCCVVSRCFPPKLHVAVRLLGSQRFEVLSSLRAFDFVSAVWARVARRRQVMAVAVRPSATGHLP